MGVNPEMKRVTMWICFLMLLPGLVWAQQTKPVDKGQPKAAAKEKEKNEEAPIDFKKVIDEYYAAWNTMDPEKADKYYSKDADLVFYDILPLKYGGWENYKNGVKTLLEPYSTFKLIPNE